VRSLFPVSWLWLYLAVINLITFCVYGADKRRARKGAWRVPEKELFLLAFLGGSPGALLAMTVFHHKTRHRAFQVGIPAILVLELGLLWWLRQTLF